MLGASNREVLRKSTVLEFGSAHFFGFLFHVVLGTVPHYSAGPMAHAANIICRG